MYKYKLDNSVIEDSMELKLLYTIFEQNEEIIKLLKMQIPTISIPSVWTDIKESPSVTTVGVGYICDKCGKSFDKPIQKAAHVRSCKK